ncbi:MAG: IS66 family insertion sequence element accessory protein TnpA [Oscillospiraceae bacterium]
MTSAELKHRAELQEWAAQIQECRSSGLSVSEWCRQQGVTTTLLASFQASLFLLRKLKSCQVKNR